MEQSELGKPEESTASSSSAELSQPEVDETPQVTSSVSGSVADDGEPALIVDEGDDAPHAAQDDDDDDEDVDDTRPANAAQQAGIKRGDILDGVVKETSPTAVIIDLGNDVEGVVPGRELELMSRKLLESLEPGAQVTVYVVNPRNHQGETVLSINHALEEMDWREAEQLFASKDAYEARIGGYNKGGLIVRFGRLRGFIPQSQIGDVRLRQMTGDTPEERFGKAVNKPITVKVMEVDRSRNRLILSERAAMREVRAKRKEALIEELREGEIREGRVVSLENFGAFVDIGGAEGLIHLTELSWKHLTHPRQKLSVGQQVKVKVISVDESQNRIGLSLKQLEQDPWDVVAAQYGRGQLVEAVITKLTKFGAFAQLTTNPEVEGLIHISELSDERVEHPRDVVQKGDRMALRVVKVDVKERRLGLSLRQVNSAEYLDVDMKSAFSSSSQSADG